MKASALPSLNAHAQETPAPEHTCRALWLAVLHLGLTNALGYGVSTLPERGASDRRAKGRALRDAQDWIGSRDFVLVCDLAGVNAGSVMRAYRAEVARMARGEHPHLIAASPGFKKRRGGVPSL
jgi:hypothetical protein